jgi:hypothetical protein
MMLTKRRPTGGAFFFGCTPAAGDLIFGIPKGVPP